MLLQSASVLVNTLTIYSSPFPTTQTEMRWKTLTLNVKEGTGTSGENNSKFGAKFLTIKSDAGTIDPTSCPKDGSAKEIYDWCLIPGNDKSCVVHYDLTESDVWNENTAGSIYKVNDIDIPASIKEQDSFMGPCWGQPHLNLELKGNKIYDNPFLLKDLSALNIDPNTGIGESYDIWFDGVPDFDRVPSGRSRDRSASWEGEGYNRTVLAWDLRWNPNMFGSSGRPRRQEGWPEILTGHNHKLIYNAPIEFRNYIDENYSQETFRKYGSNGYFVHLGYERKYSAEKLLAELQITPNMQINSLNDVYKQRLIDRYMKGMFTEFIANGGRDKNGNVLTDEKLSPWWLRPTPAKDYFYGWDAEYGTHCGEILYAFVPLHKNAYIGPKDKPVFFTVALVELNYNTGTTMKTGFKKTSTKKKLKCKL